MITLFWICWAIDIIVWLICAYETFAVSSNSSLAVPVLIMTICLGASWWLRASNLKMALIIAGIPACLVLLFVLFMVLSLILGNGNWQ